MRPAGVFLAIRIAMMGGMLLFGAVSWFLHRTPDWTPTAADELVTVGQVLWAAAALALVFLFLRSRGTADRVLQGTTAIVSWSVGEALAIFGAVHFYLTGQSTWYVAGILAMAITFVAFRPPAPR